MCGMPTPTPPQGMAARPWPRSFLLCASNAWIIRAVEPFLMSFEAALCSAVTELLDGNALIFWLAVLERRLGLWERIEGLELMAEKGPLKAVGSPSSIWTVSSSMAEASPLPSLLDCDFGNLVVLVWVCECVWEWVWEVVCEWVCFVTTFVLTPN